MPRDKRWDVYNRRDGWPSATVIHPDPESDGWICRCGRRGVKVFYGHGPVFENGRYEPGTDTRRCADCLSG